MHSLVQQRCLHHPLREAVARCPECGGYFCRECVTEHDDRVICANCLKQLAKTSTRTRLRLGGLRRAFFCGLGVLLAWIYFYEIGKTLLLIPTSFHDGTVWHNSDQ
jgi:hypothetical protein